MSRRALGRGLDALFTQGTRLDHELIDLDIDRLSPSEVQPRSVFKESKLEELAQSIRQNGIIQPLVVRRTGERFQIIAGERRWRAAQKAGLHKIPCVVRNTTEDNLLELSLIENIQREELSPIEEANAYKSLLEKPGVTQEQVAQRVGRDRSSITNALRLLKLPIEIQRLVEEEKISMGHARALLSVGSDEHQRSLAREITNRSLSVRQTEILCKKHHDQVSGSPRGTPAAADPDAANVRAAEAKLSKKLGSPVRIRTAKSAGLIEIKFSSSEDLARLFDLLMQTKSISAQG